MGYMGHINCSENFNKELIKYNVPSRKGWSAINLFFNTAIDANNVASFDEPWSRPGDYVLFRALKDLTCLSSACPCDIDAANGWNPTDIFVRTYPKEQKYSKAIAFRMKTDSEPKLTQETGFHTKTSELTRNFIEYKGYWLANNFTNSGTIKEYNACRESAIVTDLSPLRKFEILGPDAENLMQYTLTRNVKKLSTGDVAYTAMCYENGCMLDDGTIFKLGQDNFRWIGGDEYSDHFEEHLLIQSSLNVLNQYLSHSLDRFLEDFENSCPIYFLQGVKSRPRHHHFLLPPFCNFGV